MTLESQTSLHIEEVDCQLPKRDILLRIVYIARGRLVDTPGMIEGSSPLQHTGTGCKYSNPMQRGSNVLGKCVRSGSLSAELRSQDFAYVGEW